MLHATRVAIAACAALTLGALAAAPLASAKSASQYRVEGRGYGHGIGLSQYGAQGYAKRGWTAEQIISHYYTGTVAAPKPTDTPDSLRVRLVNELSTARVEVTSAGTIRQGLVTQPLLPSDVVEFTQTGGVTLQATIIRGGTRIVLAAGSVTPVTITPSLDGSLVARFKPEEPTSPTGSRYRGTITAQLVNRKVAITNTVALESYLRGVVPRESPANWEQEALRAQAIAARGYALRGITKGGYFDVYSTTSSQVYGGATAEKPTTDTAIASTAGLVARVGDANGEVAQTFFYSTSAGRSANNEDVWAGTPRSYLRSVVSPFEQESKYFTWGYKPGNTGAMRIWSPAQVAAKFKGAYSGTFKGVDVALTPSGYAKNVTVKGSTGSSTLSASTVQYNWLLGSTYFRFELLSVNAPNAIKQGQYVTLTGRAPTTGITMLTRTVRGVPAKPIAVKVDKKTGMWKAPVKVTGPSVVQLTRSGVPGPKLALKPTVVAAARR